MPLRLRSLSLVSPCLAACLAAPVLAQEEGAPQAVESALPDPVRAMLEAAAETGDAATFGAVAATAKKTNPDSAAEIAALEKDFNEARREREALAATVKERELREAGLFDNWNGRGEIGAFRSTGNSDNLGLTAALSLDREGVDWTHKLRGRADYQRSRGITSREQYFASYEPRYQIEDRLFAYGLGQFESNVFQGFDQRYAVSGGLGYKVVENDSLQLSVKGGPALRHTEFVNGDNESSLAALLGVDFDWTFAEGLKLTQDANAVAEAGGQAVALIGGPSTTLSLITGLDAKVSDRISTRFSYSVDYDSDPPLNAVSTDTLTRFTLVYGF